jgi:hypothetical protein
MPATKTSISLPSEVHRWAIAQAEQEGTSLSAVVAEGLEELRRVQAWRRVRDKLLRGKPLTSSEIARALRELQS